MTSSVSSPIASILSSTQFLSRNGRRRRRIGPFIVLMSASNSHDSIKKSTRIHSVSSSSSHNRIKVFENLSEGIVCYRDENGEVTCEGYDEGPRFDCQQQQQVPRFSTLNLRDAEVIEILERSWLKMEKMEELTSRNTL